MGWCWLHLWWHFLNCLAPHLPGKPVRLVLRHLKRPQQSLDPPGLSSQPNLDDDDGEVSEDGEDGDDGDGDDNDDDDDDVM